MIINKQKKNMLKEIKHYFGGAYLFAGFCFLFWGGGWGVFLEPNPLKKQG